MGKTLDLGQRLELLPSDNHCHDISLGLYRSDVAGVPRFVVHSYSSADGMEHRLQYLTEAMVAVLGLVRVPEQPGWLQFSCATIHLRALKRAFLDLCKLETDAPLAPKPLTVFDKKACGNITAKDVGRGIYQIVPDPSATNGPKRAVAVARGFAKLCEMEIVDEGNSRIALPCGQNHDALMGMLMFRAQNVRAAIQDEDMASTRGVLSSPSQQK